MIVYSDNAQVLEVFDKPKAGVFAYLEEQCLIQTGNKKKEDERTKEQKRERKKEREGTKERKKAITSMCTPNSSLLTYACTPLVRRQDQRYIVA